MGRVFTETPVGLLEIVSDNGFLIGVHPCTERYGETDSDEITAEAEKQLKEYFARQRRTFDLPLNPQGTEFSRKIWRALTEIPYGETRSYSRLAAMAGSPKACRAAGNACGKNPLLIIVPCHRVISADGTIGGFSEDMNIKKYLLDFEKN